MDAAELVQRQLQAYNARDLARFLATYGDDVQVFRLPGSAAILAGKQQLSDYYAAERFNRPGLRAEIVARIVLGNKVIDHERIWGVRDDPFEVVAVYGVRDALIRTVWFFAPE